MAALAALATAAPFSAHAQDPWRASYFPYFVSNENDGFGVVLHYQYARAADYEDPMPFAGILSAELSGHTHKSWAARVRFRAPRLVDGWRFGADAYAVREARHGFFAQDGAVIPVGGGDLVERVHRSRYGLWGEATRRIAGPFAAALSGTLEHVRWTDVAGPSVFNSQVGSQLEETDGIGRLALVLDLRDQEMVPGKGVVLEGGVYGGTGGAGDGYYGGYGIARGYLTLREGTVVAARLAGRALGGTPTLNAEYVIPAWEAPIEVIGGPESHRSFVPGRLHGPQVMIGNLEVRHDLINAGDFGAVTVVGFVDAGRVFQNTFRVTTDGYDVGGGGGLTLRVLRSALVSLTFAGGPDGFTFGMGTGWTF